MKRLQAFLLCLLSPLCSLCLLSILFLSIIYLSACKKGSSFNPKDEAPSFVINSSFGSSISNKTSTQITKYGGSCSNCKITLINFFASWCAGCVTEMPSLEALHKKLGKNCLNIVGIAVNDDYDEVQSMVKDLNLTFDIAMDNTSEVARKYKVTGFPESYLISNDGKFLMLTDEYGSYVTVRGERNWDRDIYIDQFLKYCK